MGLTNFLPLVLGLVLFSFTVTSSLIVPFINILYKLKIQRRKEAPKSGKVPLFDKLHDKKAGTPIGGGILIVTVVMIIFWFILPASSHMGILIRSAFDFRYELLAISLTFVGFGLLGFLDDLVKIFGKGHSGARPLGIAYGLTRKQKFLLQWILAFAISGILYFKLGIQIIHIPLVDMVINLGWGYIFFAAFVIVAFSNAFNITDGLDGLASGLLVIFLLAFGIIAGSNLDTPLSVFIAIWFGAMLSFLYFNIWPARIWLGDAGALSFGAMIAVIGLMTGGTFALLVVGAIFVIELLSSVIQIFGWKVLKRPILPLAPLHNTFLSHGWEESKIVTRAWLAGIILAIFGLWLATV